MSEDKSKMPGVGEEMHIKLLDGSVVVYIITFASSDGKMLNLKLLHVNPVSA